MKKICVSLLIVGFMLPSFANTSKITLITDPKILSVPIKESKEPWVNLTQHDNIVLGPSPEIPNNHDYTFMRKSVFDKLTAAQSKLPKGMHFCLYEGYRSLSLQKLLFEKQHTNVKKRHPDWTAEQIFIETTKLVSPVINWDHSNNIPPHSTGAAIDVYLIDDHGKALDMGIHPKDWMEDKDGILSLTASEHISPVAKKNRQIMSEVLNAVGFVNYPTEYWHWSYGDRYWAYVTKQSHAIYDSGSP